MIYRYSLSGGGYGVNIARGGRAVFLQPLAVSTLRCNEVWEAGRQSVTASPHRVSCTCQMFTREREREREREGGREGGRREGGRERGGVRE